MNFLQNSGSYLSFFFLINKKKKSKTHYLYSHYEGVTYEKAIPP